MARPHPPGPARQASLRERNLALVLQQVASTPTVSRSDVATATGLTRATVSALVDDLIAGRLVMETEPEPRAGAGRPSIGLELDPRGPAGLGLEINVDYLSVCIVDLTGTVRYRETMHADQRPRPPSEVLATIQCLATAAETAAQGKGLPLAGSALAVPGLVQQHTIRWAPNLGWRNVEVPTQVGRASLRVDNEANLAALGELFVNPNAGRDFVYVSGEIGIGAGIVIGGELLRGAHGFGGEFGHTAVQANGPACRCGARGCLEQYAGLEAMLRTAGVSTMDDLAGGAQAENPSVRKALDSAGTALGVALAGLVNVLDVETVFLGGSYARLEPWLRSPISKELDERVVAAEWASTQIRPSALAEDAAVVGAAASVVRSVWDHPAAWTPARFTPPSAER